MTPAGHTGAPGREGGQTLGSQSPQLLRWPARAARAAPTMPLPRPPEPHAPGEPQDRPRGVLRLMLTPRIVRGALKVSLVVGTILNLINNGERLWTNQAVSPWHAVLNYVVPFLVSSYSAARNEAQRSRGR